jgi:glycosyltransferase involved in cell wall biosynthesis
MTRNDAERLDRALSSVTGLADEMLVLDTGSTDSTHEVVKKHGARLIEYPWPGRFDEPLNFMLDHVETEWVLRLDSDEWLDRQFHELVRKVMAEESVFFVSLNRRDYGPGGQYNDILQNRLWRNHPLLRYIGCVHEQMPDAILLAAAEGREHIFLDIRLDHDGYLEGLTPDRLQRNLDLIELELEERPGSVFYEICRADTLFVMKDSRAFDALGDVLKRLMKREAPLDGIASAAIAQYLRALPEDRRRHPQTGKVLAFAREHFQRFPDVQWQVARTEYARGNLREAWETMVQLDRRAQAGEFSKQIGVNPLVLTTLLWQTMAELAPMIGKPELVAGLRQRIMAHERRHG